MNYQDFIPLYKNALTLAVKSHDGQVRKYSNLPYIIHPIRVANMAQYYVGMSGDPNIWKLELEMIITSLLHDVVEDCNVSLNTIKSHFGNNISNMVEKLTHESYFDKELAKQNRATRWAADIEKLKNSSLAVRMIKMCDRLDNLDDMPVDIPWTKKYLEESDDLVENISHGFSKVLLEDYDKLRERILNGVVG